MDAELLLGLLLLPVIGFVLLPLVCRLERWLDRESPAESEPTLASFRAGDVAASDDTAWSGSTP